MLMCGMVEVFFVDEKTRSVTARLCDKSIWCDIFPYLKYTGERADVIL